MKLRPGMRCYVEDPSREQPPIELFVESVEVVTEYERGVRDGILRREMLAVDVMDFTAKVERHNINLDIENQWLRYQRAGWMIISICFFVAFMVMIWK